MPLRRKKTKKKPFTLYDYNLWTMNKKPSPKKDKSKKGVTKVLKKVSSFSKGGLIKKQSMQEKNKNFSKFYNKRFFSSNLKKRAVSVQFLKKSNFFVKLLRGVKIGLRELQYKKKLIKKSHKKKVISSKLKKKKFLPKSVKGSFAKKAKIRDLLVFPKKARRKQWNIRLRFRKAYFKILKRKWFLRKQRKSGIRRRLF